METKQSIGLREFIALGIIMIGIKLTDDTPIIYFKKLANSAWMAPLLSAGMIAVLLYFLISTTEKFDNQNLVDLIFTLFGKYIGWIAILYLWAALFTALIIDTAIYTDLISTMYFPNTPMFAIYFLMMVICGFGAYKGIQAIGSTAWAIFLYITVALICALLITITHGQFDFLFPFLGNGTWPVIKESLKAITIYDELLYLGILSTMLPSKKDFKKGSWIIFGVVITEITLAMISFLMIFDYKSIQLLSYPWHEVIRYISLGFLQNVETLFFPFWLVGLIIRFGAYLYLIVYMFGRLFNIKEFQLLVPIFSILVVFLGVIPEQPTFTLPIIRSKLIMFTVIPTCSITVLLWVLAKFKTRGKKHAN